MSEANILNPTSASLLNFTFGYREGIPILNSEFLADSGEIFSRQNVRRGRVFELFWDRIDTATMHLLRQWEEQYRLPGKFFTLADYERSRYFSGRFAGPLTFAATANQNWNVSGRFEELIGKAMYAYPSNWSRDAIFIEERADDGADFVKVSAGWSYLDSANYHGGHAYSSSTTNATAEWIYFGYGFRLWHYKTTSYGEGVLTVTRIRDGVVVLAATTIDCYASPAEAVAAVYTVTDLPLDTYRVEWKVKGTKNAGSSGYTINADAIEVMR